MPNRTALVSDGYARLVRSWGEPGKPCSPQLPQGYDINPVARTVTEKRFDQRSEQAKDLCLFLYRLQLIMINYLRSQGEYIHS